ncbi:hypothetical protein O7622_04780 [Micromonospora sp. WMMD1076]|uniref:hypothetical protein n=1 Tax=Micromonospora sp. WMMD1076 TaxID=3016103 RepID=UPI00249C2B0E|nr:hypothetical protein [Micromonospora sp. WMMD1076]WFF07896.1 hypothetical protein O7622_04780 [Micromonospora sp. WMMD1076]
MDFAEPVIDGRIDIDRNDLEDALNEALVGHGEVTGAGTGEHSSHLDVDVRVTADRRAVPDAVFGMLAAQLRGTA